MYGCNKDRLSQVGSALVALGVAVWGVYALVRWGFGWQVAGKSFLPYHLAGVIPGMILKRRKFLGRMIRKIARKNDTQRDETGPA